MKISRIDIIGQNGNTGEHYCDHEWAIRFRSINKKMCRKCYLKVEWNLDPGQKPLVTSSKDRGI